MTCSRILITVVITVVKGLNDGQILLVWLVLWIGGEIRERQGILGKLSKNGLGDETGNQVQYELVLQSCSCQTSSLVQTLSQCLKCIPLPMLYNCSI